MRKKIALLLTLMLTAGFAGSASVTAVNSTDWDYTVPHSSNANQASFWVNHFEGKGYTDVSCTKYGSSHSGWLPGRYEAGIVKAGQINYVWLQPDSAGRQLTAPQGLSHIFKCNFDGPPKRPDYEPWGNYMVCGDPRLLLELQNYSDFSVTYRISWKSARTQERRVAHRTVGSYGTKQFIRWVMGRTDLRVTAKPAKNAVYPSIYSFPKVVLFSGRIQKTTRWGVGACPSSLKSARNGW